MSSSPIHLIPSLVSKPDPAFVTKPATATPEVADTSSPAYKISKSLANLLNKDNPANPRVPRASYTAQKTKSAAGNAVSSMAQTEKSTRSETKSPFPLSTISQAASAAAPTTAVATGAKASPSEPKSPFPLSTIAQPAGVMEPKTTSWLAEIKSGSWSA